MKPSNPFNSSSQARLRHMGVLQADNRIDEQKMPIFAGIFCGLFYDDLCTHYQDAVEIAVIFQIFKQLFEQKNYAHMYLFMSIQYDNMRRQLPDPVWWLAGNKAVVQAFMEHFMMGLSAFMDELEISADREVE